MTEHRGPDGGEPQRDDVTGDERAEGGVPAEPVAPGEHSEHEVTSLRRLFAERRLSIATMDRPLRVATAGAVASVLATVLLLALRDVGSSNVYLGRSQGAVTQIGEPLFIAVLVLISIGFG
ncbi:MAG: hypothetical protein QOG34_2428, partial [Frankiaceae bacterium]|nr:hypothetical protein [Frankiaceae bacterium]